MTTHRAIFIHGDVAGLNILVTRASGRVEYYAAQLAKPVGASVIATASSEARWQIARQTGAGVVLNYRTDDLVAAITEFTQGKGVDRIIEVEFGVNSRRQRGGAEKWRDNFDLFIISGNTTDHPVLCADVQKHFGQPDFGLQHTEQCKTAGYTGHQSCSCQKSITP